MEMTTHVRFRRDIRIIVRLLASIIDKQHSACISAAARARHDTSITDIYTTQQSRSNRYGAYLNAGLAFLGASLAGVSTLPPAACEVPPATEPNLDKDYIEKYIKDLCRRLDEQLYRIDAAQMASGGGSRNSTSLPPIPIPQIDIDVDGNLNIIFEVPQTLDVEGAVDELRRRFKSTTHGLGSTSMSVAETSTSGPRGVARRLRRSSLSPSSDHVTVDVLEPFNQSEAAQIEFQGPATRELLNVITAGMLRAARPARSRHGQATLNDLSRLFFDALGEEDPGLSGGGLDPFFAPLKHLMDELHRFHAEQYGFERSGPSGDGIPFQPPPKRFDRIHTDDGPLDNNDTALTSSTIQSAIRKLEGMGCQVFLPAQAAVDNKTPGTIDWGQLAGYDDQKRAIEDCLLLPLLRPEVYDRVARGTRENFQPNRPRAVLFVGPPGTGKTTSARVIASQASVPMVYIPMEALVSKWYGESEKHLAAAFKEAESFPDGCIIFLDELDSLATARGGEMHEATRRVLGVLLRHMDGFDTSNRSVVVGATNRPQDLDIALRNRFSALVAFELPSESCRRAILKKYAHHLNETEIGALAGTTSGMAGRDLRDVCEQAERRWAAAIVRGQASEKCLPPLRMYMDAAKARHVEMSKGKGG